MVKRIVLRFYQSHVNKDGMLALSTGAEPWLLVFFILDEFFSHFEGLGNGLHCCHLSGESVNYASYGSGAD